MVQSDVNHSRPNFPLRREYLQPFQDLQFVSCPHHITSFCTCLNYTLNSIPTSPHFSVHPAVVLQTLIVILLFNLLTLFFHSLLTVHPLFIHFIFFIIFFLSKKPTTIYINQHMSSSISRI